MPGKRGPAQPVAPKPCRQQQMLAKGERPSLPPISVGAHLVGHLFDVGPVEQGAAGPAVLSHGTLRHWQDNTGLCLPPWQLSLLRRLSADWIEETERARDPLARAPGELISQNDRQSISKKLDQAFAALGFNKSQNKGPRRKPGG